MWSIVGIRRLKFSSQYVLPTAEFQLQSGTDKKTVLGWLPCHHGHVQYELLFRPGRIARIVDIHFDRKTPSKTKVIQQTSRRIKKKGFAPNGYTSAQYETQAEQGLHSIAIRVCAVLFTHWEIRNMDIEDAFRELSDNIENIVRDDSPVYKARFVYDPAETKILIQRALRHMGNPPREDWTPFDARLAWRNNTDTASRQKLSEHIANVERYQNLWTTSDLIEQTRTIASVFRPDKVTLIQGSPSPSNIPESAVVVFHSTEDIYRWKCLVDTGTFAMMSHSYTDMRLKELGVHPVRRLEKNEAIIVPWAHRWNQSQWVALARFRPRHITAIGRVDQWPLGRGQVFRDMIRSEKFEIVKSYHLAVDCVHMIQTNDIASFVEKMREKHKVVQCFSNESHPNIDCNRRYLTNPRRTRTLRDPAETQFTKEHVPLYEEMHVHAPDKVCGNASVQKVRYYRGLRVPAAVYMCSEKTTPFDVHLARSHCKDALYILNCSTCLFSMNKTAPLKTSINPFI